MSKRPRSAVAAAPRPAAFHACHRCGGEVPHAGRVYCDDCLPHYQREQFAQAFSGSGLTAIEQRKQDGADPTHGGKASARRAAANVERKRELREWDERHGKLTDLSAFEREILPRIQGVPLSQLVSSTGLSLRYCSQIRRGERVPHPRHWEHFRVTDTTAYLTAADAKPRIRGR